MPKIIINEKKAREAIMRGVDTIADVVSATLGPKGRNIVLDRGGQPTVTNDGVTIAREISLEDPFENIGAVLIKKAAEKTNDVAGDGTTTATVLAQAILKQGQAIEGKANVYAVRRGIEKATSFVVEKLKEAAKPVSTSDEVANVGTISSLDPEVGKMISECMSEMGNEGVITVEENNKVGLDKEVVKGLQIDRGYIAPHMVTNPQKMTAEWKDPYILVTDYKLSFIEPLKPVLEQIIQAGHKDLVIIADDIDGEVLGTLVVNKLNGIFNGLGIKAPNYGSEKTEILKDIAILTGATFISEAEGRKLETITLEDLGNARSVTATKDSTVFVDGGGDLEKIEARIKEIEQLIEYTSSHYEKKEMEKRVSKLKGGIAVIKVGAPTEPETRERKYKIEDAINAVKAAVQEGIVEGGGSALVKISPLLENLKGTNADEQLGIDIIREAILAPFKQIAENCGIEQVETERLAKILQDPSFDPSQGFDFGNYESSDLNSGFKNLFEAGVIDP
ncbi:MAG TPA: molecular chaperone GroEL, partial [Flavobacterium sp.]|nr:molecular chaperone GroEL [Flavobacterium sp.]